MKLRLEYSEMTTMTVIRINIMYILYLHACNVDLEVNESYYVF